MPNMLKFVPPPVAFNYKLPFFDTTAGVNPKPLPFCMFNIFLVPIVELNTCGVYINLPPKIQNGKSNH